MNIKNILFLLPFAMTLACSNSESAKTDFEIKGKFSNAHGETVFLEQLSTNGLKSVDSVKISETGEFEMHPVISDIGFYRLKISEKNFATLILDTKQKVVVNGDAQDLGNTYTVEGSADSKLFWDVSQASAANYKKRDELQKRFQAFMNTAGNDSVRIDSMSKTLEKPYNELVDQHNVFLKKFIEKNSNSFASLAAIQQLPAEDFLETYIKLDDGLFGKYPNSDYIKAFHESVASQKKLAIGTLAPEITMNNPAGTPLSLSSLKGKVVLIDFWASWCKPCRAENPNVVMAYNKYRSKGFEIFSVSLDKDMENWKQAIQQDHLSWINHVSDLKFWQSPVVALYNVSSIPTNVLIDKDGKILAKNLRGEDLEKKLAEIFK